MELIICAVIAGISVVTASSCWLADRIHKRELEEDEAERTGESPDADKLLAEEHEARKHWLTAAKAVDDHVSLHGRGTQQYNVLYDQCLEYKARYEQRRKRREEACPKK